MSVRVAIDSTPVQGLEVHIEGDSSSAAGELPQTDESGVASELVNSKDMVSISSALAAIQFDPVTGLATALYQLGIIDIPAWRVMEPTHLCRYLDGNSRESVAFYVNNMTSQTLEVPRRVGLNSLHAGDNSLTETQPPESFAPGLSIFSVSLDEFRLSSGTGSCASGKLKLLAAEKSFGCESGQVEPEIPLCEGRAELPCVTVENATVRDARERVKRALKSAKRMEAELKRRYPDINRGYSLTQELVLGTRRINNLMNQVSAISSSCSHHNPRCTEVIFPREALIKTFKQSFGPRPPKGRIYFRAVRKYHVERFRKLLKRFPETLVKCE